MENREYFFHKRRAMTQMRDPSDNTPISEEVAAETPAPTSVPEGKKNKKAESQFFDSISSSCRLQGMESDLSTGKSVRFVHPKKEHESKGARTVTYQGEDQRNDSRGRGYGRQRQHRK